MNKRWSIIEVEDKVVNKLKRELKIDTVFCRLLVQRGITNKEEANLFLNPTLEQLHDPFLMKDMDLAVERLGKAIKDSEKVLIYGDYDVDGTSGVAMFYSFLQPLNKNTDYYIPNRYKEGYGLSQKGIEYAAEKGCTLMVVIDCGVKAHALIDEAASKGIDVIVCDHHTPEGEMPKAVAVLDPKREDCEYPFKELCGCGVAFKLVQGYAQKNDIPLDDITDLLDFVAIATSCDIVSMTDENRVLTRFGLEKLNDSPRASLEALIETTRRKIPLSVNDVVFGFGPIINAPGRLAEGREAVDLLVEKDKEKALEMAAKLREHNMERKQLERDMAEQAERMVRMEPEIPMCLVLHRQEWNKGVLGIVASRMVERFNRPALLLTEAPDGRYVGSARSLGGFDIYQALKGSSDLLDNFGGHKYAAGVTLTSDKIEAFRDRMNEIVKETTQPDQFAPSTIINSALRLKDITPEFWETLCKFAPFGPQNMRPLFMTKTIRDTGFAKIVGENHLSLSMRQGRSETKYGIAFGQAKFIEKIRTKPFAACYVLEENSFAGKTTVRMNVKEIYIPKK